MGEGLGDRMGSAMEQEWDWLFGVETELESKTVSGIVRRHCERNGEIISHY